MKRLGLALGLAIALTLPVMAKAPKPVTCMTVHGPIAEAQQVGEGGGGGISIFSGLPITTGKAIFCEGGTGFMAANDQYISVAPGDVTGKGGSITDSPMTFEKETCVGTAVPNEAGDNQPVEALVIHYNGKVARIRMSAINALRCSSWEVRNAVDSD